jgi:hypothetical protein
MIAMKDTERLYQVEVEFEGHVRRSKPVAWDDAVVLQTVVQIGGLEEARIVPAREAVSA